ncbi:hypothetical protein LTR84_008786 [Exophiala bonariae]|uniref:Uncharacterized protein n=1 Tax=Exophiala bonariae TaxID=1690606 RepID=A0AAV9MWS6_9EURO|nr:hypothetical protein LTR84_008786 [Exophiala bonariae]
MPTYDEASKLPYLSNVIDETLRLWGPLNTGIPRISTGRMIGGEYFPAGVGISNNPYATARDPEVFPDPEAYEPDRFKHDRGKDETERSGCLLALGRDFAGMGKTREQYLITIFVYI